MSLVGIVTLSWETVVSMATRDQKKAPLTSRNSYMI